MITAKEVRKRVERLKEQKRIARLKELDTLATEQDMTERKAVEDEVLQATSPRNPNVFHTNCCEIKFDISANTEEYLKLNFFGVKRINNPRDGCHILVCW